MMLPTFRKRYLSIAQPQVAGVSLALITITTEAPFPTSVIAYVSLIGYGVILFFWSAFFLSFPNVSKGRQKMLFTLYHIGQAAFLITATVALWSLFSSFGDVLHWLLVGLGLLEFSEHFVVRWIDGNGRLFIRRPSHAWRGGAVKIALQHSSRTMKSKKALSG
jgi:hypothetical protein